MLPIILSNIARPSVDTDWEHSCYQCSPNVLMGHKLDSKNLGLKAFLKEK